MWDCPKVKFEKEIEIQEAAKNDNPITRNNLINKKSTQLYQERQR